MTIGRLSADFRRAQDADNGAAQGRREGVAMPRHRDQTGGFSRSSVSNPCPLWFPCDDSSFDFAFATSVFTHMPREDTEHYLTEIGRALKPGGSLLSTWFLLNDSSRAQIAQCDGALKIVHRWEGSTVRFPEVPEGAAGYSEQLVMSMHGRGKPKVGLPVRYGNWTGRSDYTTYQDLIVASR